MKSLLKVKNLHVSFCRESKWQEAVLGIDFEVFEGKTLGVVGESGSGKSVSNLAVMQLLDRRKSRVVSDAIILDGNDISRYSDDEMTDVRGKKIAMIFQEPMTSLNPVYKCGFQVMEAISELQNSKTPEPQKHKEKVLELFRKVLLPRKSCPYAHKLFCRLFRQR